MLLCTFSIFAQNKVITVSGRVVESDTKEPAAQATVQLLSLPDSAYAAGIASSNQGWFTLPKVKAGKYVLKVSYIGFRTKLVPVQLSANATDKKLGTITLDPDAVMLKEAVITAEAPPVTVKADTTEYSAAAYPVPEGSMLEELVKKIPGAEVSDEGKITINGKEIKKIMVDGKEFFSDDPKVSMKNLPANMIEKGVNVNMILEETFFRKTYNQMMVTAKIQSEAVLALDGKCIYGYCTSEMMEEYGVTTKDLDAVVASIRNVDGVEVAMFLCQLSEDSYKVSLRSKNYVDVSKIAVENGGGGHVRAAGAEIHGELNDIINKLLNRIKQDI